LLHDLTNNLKYLQIYGFALDEKVVKFYGVENLEEPRER